MNHAERASSEFAVSTPPVRETNHRFNEKRQHSCVDQFVGVYCAAREKMSDPLLASCARHDRIEASRSPVPSTSSYWKVIKLEGLYHDSHCSNA